MSDVIDGLLWLRPAALWLLLPWGLQLLFGRWFGGFIGRAGGHFLGGGGDAASPADESAATSPWRTVVDSPLLAVQLSPTVPLGSTVAPDRASPAVALAGLLLILALAGPQLSRPDDARPLRPDIARVLLVDLSPAFARLSGAEQQRLRSELRRFVSALPAGETALVVAAADAWLVVPPTEDVAALEIFLSELSADAVPRPGDQPLLGRALARRTLAATGARRQEIYWLRLGKAPPAAGGAAQSGVKEIFLQASAGAEAWRRQIDEAKPVSAGWRDSLLNLAPRPAAGIDCGPLLVLFALPLLLWGRRASSAILLLPLTLAAGLVLPMPVEAAAPDFERGAAAYRAGRYDEATAAFADLPADDARAHYNRGNALARAGRLRAALAAYDESLRLRPDDTSTRHNREIVARLLQSPPPPPPPSAPPDRPPSPNDEARRAAEQWLRRPPAAGAGLLQRKLAHEETRRSGRATP